MKQLLFRQWLQEFARKCFGWLFRGPRTPYRKRADVDRLLRHVPALQLLEKRQAPTAVRGTDLLAAAFAPAPNAPPAQSSILPPAVLNRIDGQDRGGDDPDAWSIPSGMSIGELLHQAALRQAGFDGVPARNNAPADTSDPPRFSVGLDGSRALSFNYFNALVSADELLSDPLDDGGSAPRSRLPAGSAAPSASAAGGSSGLSPLNLGATVSGYTPQRLGGTNQQIPVAQPNNSGAPGSSTANSSTSPTAATGTVATQTTLQALQDPLGAGSWVILTATVAAKDSSGTPPTGTVSFYSGKVLLGEAPLTDGPNGDQASFFIDSTRAGMESFTASYSGDATYAASSGHLQLPPKSSFSTVPALQTPGLSGTSTPGSGLSTPSVGSLGGGVTTPSGGASSGSSSSDPGDSVTSSTSDDSSGSSSPSLRFSPLLSPAPVGTSTSLTATPAAVTVGQGGVTLTATVFTSGAAALPVYQTVSFYADGSYLGWVYLTEVVAGQYVATDVDSSLNAGSHAYSANYSGSGTGYLGSTATASDVVASVSTANSLSVMPATVTVGQAVTLTATVLSAGATALPAGYVSFYADGSYVGQAALTEVVGGTYVATLADSSLNAGSYTFSDSYAGSGTNFLASSATAAATVDPVSTTNSLSVTPGTVTVGQALTLTATVVGSGEALPSAYVSFYANGTYVGQAYLNQVLGDEYVATLADASLNAGSYSFSESYSAGSSNYLGSSASAAAVVVGSISTSSALTATPGTVTVGQAVTLTATVLSSEALALPSGNVSFYADGSYVGEAALTEVVGGTYVAAFADSSLNAGSYSFSASYSGSSSNYLGSSATTGAVVEAVSTTNSLSATPGTIAPGQSLTLTATVLTSGALAVPLEYVSFYANGTYVGQAYLGEVVGGTYAATFVDSSLGAGTYSLSESYSGSGSNYLGSSASASAVVEAVTTTNSLSVTPGSITAGQGVTLTATILTSDAEALAGNPYLTAYFYANGTYVGISNWAEVSGGDYVATFVDNTLGAGSYSFSESYSGNGTSYLGSTATASDVIAAVSTSNSLSATPATVTYGQGLTLTATVIASGAEALPTGLVSFYADGTLIGTSYLTAAAGGTYVASFVDTDALNPGAYAFSDSYGGSGASYLGSSGTTGGVIEAISTSAALSASATSITADQAVTLSALIVSDEALPLYPAVAFYANGDIVAGADLSLIGGDDYEATVTVADLAAGSYSFSVVYAGDGGDPYLGSSATASGVTLPGSPGTVTTSTTLSVSPSPLSLGEAVTLTATVTTSGGVELLTGAAETFYVNGGTLGTAALTQVAPGTYQAAYVDEGTGLSPGSHTFSAAYSAAYPFGSDYVGSPATATDFVNSISTSSALSVSPSPLSLGEAVTLSATVYVSGGNTLPGGSVETFYDGFGSLGTVALTEVAAGEYVAVFVDEAPSPGSHNFTASYSASYPYTNSEYTGSSATATDLVHSVTTSSALSLSASPLSLGEAVTLSATVYVSGGNTLPGGSAATFYDNGGSLGTVGLTEVASGEYEATLVDVVLSPGSQTFTAGYSASYPYNSSEYAGSSATATDLVHSVTTSSALSVSPSPLSLGEAVTLTATVYVSGGGTLPSGAVETFYDNYGLLGTTALTEVAAGEYQAVFIDDALSAGSQTFTAGYSASYPYDYGQYGGSSATATDFVHSITTSSALSVSPSPVTLGQAVTLTATVYTSGGDTLAGGSTETFYSNYASLGSAALNEIAPGDYQAVLVAIPSGLGSQTFTASYSAPYGYGSDYGASSATATDFVSSISTSSSLSASPSPASLGEAVTLTATVYASGTTPLPVGSGETFYDGYAELGTAALSSVAAGEYQADFVVNGLSAGSQSFTATYAAPYPDGSEYGGSSAETTDFVHSISTSSSLSATPDPVTLGEAVTLTATVYTSGGNTLPGDSFESFYVNGSYLGSTVLTLITPGEYQAVFVDNVPSPGSLTFTATYAGSGSNYSGSSAEATDYAVYGISSTLTATPDPTTYASSATLTATLLPSTTLSLSGTESFYFDGELLGTAAITSTGSQYQAILVTADLPGGDDLLSAVFAGNSTYGSTTATFAETVDPAPTSTDLAASPNPVTAGDAVTLTASVSGPGTVFGEVEFLDGADVLGSATLDGTATATLVVSDLPAGTDALTAVYEGNTDYLSSTSSPVSQVVDALPGSGTVIVAAQDTTYTGTLATFSSASGSIDDYSATILWGDGQSSTGTIVSDGSGSYSVVGSHAYAQQGAYAVAVEIKFDGSVAGVAADAAFVLDPASDSQLDTVLSATVTGSGSLATTLGLGSGDYDLSGSGTASFGMTEVVATPDGTLTLTETGSLGFSLSESGDTGGFTMTAYSLGDSGTDVATLNQGINDLTDDVTETETITDGFTLVKTGDDATGGFTQTGTDTATTVMATGGTDGDGSFTLDQTTTATTTTYEGGNYLSGSFNLTAFQSATASFTESGNDGPITYTQTGSTSSGSTMFETGDLNTGSFHVTNFSWDSYTQTETGDDVAGDDGQTTNGGDTDTQSITGNNQTGAYTLTDTSTSSSTVVMSGNDESDDYSITEIDSASQTVTETASETSGAYTMTVTSADSASDTGGDVDAEMTDGYSATDSDFASSTEIGNYLTGSVTMTGLTTLSDSDNDTADDQGDDVTDGDSDTDVDHWTASGNTNSGSWSETDNDSIIAESAHSTMFDGPETISVSTTATGSLHDSEGGDDETGSDSESDTGTSSGTSYLSIYNQGLSNFVTTFFSDKNTGTDAGDTLTGAETTGDSSTSSTTSISNLYLGMLTEWTTTHSKNTETDADSDNTNSGSASESSSGTDSGNVSQTVQDQGYSDFISTLFSGSLNLTDVGNTLTGSNALGGFGNSSTTSTSNVSDGPVSQSIVSTSSNSETDSDNGNDLSGSDTDTAGDSDSGTVVETSWDQGLTTYLSTYFSDGQTVTDLGNTLSGAGSVSDTGTTATSSYSTITDGPLSETITGGDTTNAKDSGSDNSINGSDSESSSAGSSGSMLETISDQGYSAIVSTFFSGTANLTDVGDSLTASDVIVAVSATNSTTTSNVTDGPISQSIVSTNSTQESGTDTDSDLSGSDSELASEGSSGTIVQSTWDQGLHTYLSTYFSDKLSVTAGASTLYSTASVTETGTSSTSSYQTITDGPLAETITSSDTANVSESDNDNNLTGSDVEGGSDSGSGSVTQSIYDQGYSDFVTTSFSSQTTTNDPGNTLYATGVATDLVFSNTTSTSHVYDGPVSQSIVSTSSNNESATDTENGLNGTDTEYGTGSNSGHVVQTSWNQGLTNYVSSFFSGKLSLTDFASALYSTASATQTGSSSSSSYSTISDGPLSETITSEDTTNVSDSDHGNNLSGSDTVTASDSSSGSSTQSIYDQAYTDYVTTFFGSGTTTNDLGNTLYATDVGTDAFFSNTRSISNVTDGPVSQYAVSSDTNQGSGTNTASNLSGSDGESSSDSGNGSVVEWTWNQGVTDYLSTYFSDKLSGTDVANALYTTASATQSGTSSTSSYSTFTDSLLSETTTSSDTANVSETDSDNGLSGSDSEAGSESGTGSVTQSIYDQNYTSHATTTFGSQTSTDDVDNSLYGTDATTDTGTSSTTTRSVVTQGSLTESSTTTGSNQESESDTGNSLNGSDSEAASDSGSGLTIAKIYNQALSQFVTTNFSSSTTTTDLGDTLYGTGTGTNTENSSTSSVSNLTEGSLSESATSSSSDQESASDSGNSFTGSDSETGTDFSSGSNVAWIFSQGMTNYASTFFSGNVNFTDKDNALSGTESDSNTGTSSTSSLQTLTQTSLTESMTSSTTSDLNETDGGDTVAGSVTDADTDTSSTTSNETIIDEGSTVSFSATSSDTDDESDVDNDASGSVSETDDDTASFTQIETNSNDGLSAATTVIGSDSNTVTTTGDDVTDDLGETDAGSGSDTQTATGTNSRGTFTLSETDSTSTSSTQSDDAPDGSYSTSTATTTTSLIHQWGGDGTTSYSDSITSSVTNSQLASGDEDTGVFTVTTTANATTTTQESGTYAPADSTYSFTQTSSTSSLQVQIGNTGTGAYVQTGTQSVYTTLNEDGWDSAGSFDLTKTSSFAASSYQTGNSSTGAYSLTESDTAGYTATESTSNTGGAATYTESTSTNSTKSEVGNSDTGVYSRTVTGTSTANDVDVGTDAAGSFSVSETQSGSFSQQQTGNSVSGDYVQTGTGTTTYSVYETGTGSAGSFSLNETGTENTSTTQTGNTILGTYSENQTGTDVYVMGETGTVGTSPFVQGITGQDVFTLTQAGNNLTGEFSSEEVGTGTATVNLSMNGLGLPTDYDSYGYAQTESGSTLAGNISMSESGSDRYSLLEMFNNVSNAGNGTPGNMNYSPEGRPFADPGFLVANGDVANTWLAWLREQGLHPQSITLEESGIIDKGLVGFVVPRSEYDKVRQLRDTYEVGSAGYNALNALISTGGTAVRAYDRNSGLDTVDLSQDAFSKMTQAVARFNDGEKFRANTTEMPSLTGAAGEGLAEGGNNVGQETLGIGTGVVLIVKHTVVGVGTADLGELQEGGKVVLAPFQAAIQGGITVVKYPRATAQLVADHPAEFGTKVGVGTLFIAGGAVGPKGGAGAGPRAVVPDEINFGRTGSVPNEINVGRTGPVPNEINVGRTGPVPNEINAGRTGPVPNEINAGRTGPAPNELNAGRTGPAPAEVPAPKNGKFITCFPADTAIATEHGQKAIQDVQASDRVWAFDLVANEWKLRHVIETYQHEHDGDMVAVSVAGEEIKSTAHHPWWVVRGEALGQRPQPEHVPTNPVDFRGEGRWVDAIDLRVGDVLLLRSGEQAPVTSVIMRNVQQPVYNFHVEELQCYAVGHSQVLVHNNSAEPVPLSGKVNAPNATDSVLQDAYRNLWRPQDTRPGGTIGELLREAESGGPLTHLQKAKERLTSLLNRVNDTANPLSAADRAGAERVINDLKDAIRIAEGR